MPKNGLATRYIADHMRGVDEAICKSLAQNVKRGAFAPEEVSAAMCNLCVAVNRLLLERNPITWQAWCHLLHEIKPAFLRLCDARGIDPSRYQRFLEGTGLTQSNGRNPKVEIHRPSHNHAKDVLQLLERLRFGQAGTGKPDNKAAVSLPMSLANIANRLGNMTSESAKKYLVRLGALIKISRQQWQVKLDLLPPNQQEKLTQVA